MFIRLVQSALVRLGCCMLSIPLLILGFQFYIRHLVHGQPGLGAVAGGIAPSLLVFLMVFLGGFAGNWWITRPQRSAR